MKKLYVFQKVGLDFLRIRPRAILADQMGLGKTAQAISAVKAKDFRKVLVVCPSIVRNVWKKQFAEWHPELTVQVVDGVFAQREKQITSNAQVIIIHYDILRLHENLIVHTDWECIICDEAHRLKNRNAKMTKVMFRTAIYRKKATIWLLTGTPVMNRGEELWSLLHILDPVKFSSFWRWVNEWFDVKEKNFRGSFPIKVIGSPKNSQLLKDTLKDVLLRRVKKDVFPDMPDVLHEQVLLSLNKEQRKAYMTMYANLYAEIKGKEISAANILSKDIYLRQIAISPDLLNKDIESLDGPKVDYILEMLADTDTKVLIFSQFAQCIKRITKILNAAGIKTAHVIGEDTDKERTLAIQAFKKDTQVLAMTIGAGGTGLDGLQDVCSTLVFIDKHWNPAMNNQVIGRLDRIGQTETVSVISLLAEYTIEARIEARLAAKEQLADDIIPINDIIIEEFLNFPGLPT